MPINKAKARIKINELLKEPGWRLLEDENGPAQKSCLKKC